MKPRKSSQSPDFLGPKNNKFLRLGVLFSGGKDSCLALHKTIKQGHEICVLLSILPENFDSYMFHKPYLNLLKKQAEELGIKLITVKSRGVKEEELDDLKELLKKSDEIEGIAVGGIASNYQGERVKKICDDLGLKFIAPLLGYKPEDVWKELFEEGFEVILTKTACDGFGREWIGKIIDEKEFLKLKKLSERYKF